MLKLGGFLFITFPYMAPLRTFKSKFNKYPLLKNCTLTSDRFYQFAFDYKHVLEDAEKIGFKLRYKKAISGIKGFKDEVTFFSGVLQKLVDYNGESFLIKGSRFFLDRCLSYIGAGHMMLLVLELEK